MVYFPSDADLGSAPFDGPHGDSKGPEGGGLSTAMLPRRTLVSGALGAAAAAWLAPGTAWGAANPAPLHGHDMALVRLAGGTHAPVRTFRDTTTSVSPYCFTRTGWPAARGRLVVGCTGLTNQLQAFDPATGALTGLASSVTAAQAGVQQAVYMPKISSLVAITSSGIYRIDSAMKRTLVGVLGNGVTAGYGPTLDSSGRVWFGTYGRGGKGTFARIDAGAKTVTMMPRIAANTDYVRCVSVAGTTVWGGTGAVRPRLVSMNMATPGVYRTYTLPGGAAHGYVGWVNAWSDYVVVNYRHTDGVSRTSVLKISTGTFKLLPRTAMGRSVVRVGGRIYFFTSNSVESYDLATGRSTTAYPGWSLRTVHVSLAASAPHLKIAAIAYDPSGDVYRSVVINLQTRRKELDVRLPIRPSALKVQTIYSSRDGCVYAGGYQGDSLSRITPATGAVRRSPKGDPINQIESMVDVDASTLLVASYEGADVIRYARSTGISRSVAHLGKLHQQSRPFGMAIAGGRAVVGCVPAQGTQGGGLTVLDAATGAVVRHLGDIVGKLSVVGLFGRGNIVYGSTSIMAAYGAPNAPGWAQVFAYDVARDAVLWRTTLPREGEINSPVLVGSYVYVSVANGVVRLRADNGRPNGTYRIYATRAAAGYRSTRIAYHPATGSILHGGGGQITAVQIATRKTWVVAKGGYSYPVVGPSGKLYAIRGSRDVSELKVAVPAR